MNLKIEIIGLPASGKTFFCNHLKKKIKFEKKNYISVINFKNLLIKKYLKTKTNINIFKKYTYKMYVKNIQVKSKFLFKNEYEDLNKFLNNHSKKVNDYNKILYFYKKYINCSTYSSERKKRMIKNFEIDLIGFKFIDNKFIFNIFDEGFFQKIFFNLNYKKKFKFGLSDQINYLKLVPNPDIIVFFDTNIKTCLERSKNRDGGFLYDKKILSNLKKNFLNKTVINFAKKKKDCDNKIER